MSICIAILKKIFKNYNSIDLWFIKKYQNSKIHKLISLLWKGTENKFKHSFLGRIAQIEARQNRRVLDNSKVIRWLISLYKKYKMRIIIYLKTSEINRSIMELKNDLYFSPLKIVGVFLVTTTLTNIILSFMLKKEILLFGWIVRGLLLCIGLIGLFSNANCEDLKKTSLFVNRLNI